MDTSKWIFYGSVILNVALAVALFLKTAINEIVRDWWKERRQHKKEKQNILHKLNQYVDAYPAYYFSFTTQVVLVRLLPTEQMMRRFENAIKGIEGYLKDFLEFTTSNEFRFPESIRTDLQKLREIGGAVEALALNISEVEEKQNRVGEICCRLKRLVEQELKRFQ